MRLIELSELEGLPSIRLPDEQYAYGIKRFDRSSNGRIHTEDFAQVFGLYPSDKYQRVNYEQLGNGDAHLKNWTLIYGDMHSPRLSPLYDVVFTAPYIEHDSLALNMAGTKQWVDITMQHFQVWAEKAGAPWVAIKPHLIDVMNLARKDWLDLLQELPMQEEQKAALKLHWQQLSIDFKVE